MEDSRATKRVPFSATIEQLLEHGSDYPKLDSDDKFFGGKAINLSSGGIAFESSSIIDPLSPVYIIFSCPDPGGSHQIRGDGYVAHATHDGERYVLGIRFVDLSPEDQSAIDAYIISDE